jgi:hypothetical protein
MWMHPACALRRKPDHVHGPPYPSIRIDQASASALSAALTALMASLRAPSARILAPMIRLPAMPLGLASALSGHHNSQRFKTRRRPPERIVADLIEFSVLLRGGLRC